MELNYRKNEWRRAQTAKVREERVITGYIETKYPKIYAEAAAFYNRLNKKYPSKCDLRKTNDYHVWKTTITGETVKSSSTKKAFPNIKKHTYVDIESSSDTKKYEDNLQLKIPLMPYENKSAKTPGSNQKPETDATQAPLDGEIEKIMDELRKDPCLGGFFSNLNPPVELAELVQDPPVESTEIQNPPVELAELVQDPPVESTEIQNPPVELAELVQDPPVESAEIQNLPVELAETTELVQDPAGRIL